MSALSTPGALVIGLGLFGAFVGIGLYFGLRSRPGPAVDAAESILASADASVPRSRLPSGRAEPPAAPVEESTASDGAKRAIDAQHRHLVEACWNPSLARSPSPPRVTLAISLEYGEDGHLILHSLTQTAGARADVTMCVDRELVLPLTVSAPKRRERVAVPITLP